MSNAYEPSDDMVTSEPLGDDDEVVQTENLGVETPGGGEFPDRDTPPDEAAGAGS
jgi:hypothetical protein